ncbi:hypothetical protein ACHAPJ_012347 [Fusarium lateritium]
MEVYAYTHHERSTPESRRIKMYPIPGIGVPDGITLSKWFSGATKEDINNFLSQQLDLLVISLPLSGSTQGLLGAEQFQVLGKNHKKTFISNIARGPIIDMDALVHALENGLIRGAALDVTSLEPLPRGHPLWRAPNCVVTPHISWLSAKYLDVLVGLLVENLERLANGEPVVNLSNNKVQVKNHAVETEAKGYEAT